MALDADLKAAQTAWQKRDAVGLVTALEQALEHARAEAPLEVRAVVVINHDHTGLGAYRPSLGDVVEGRRARLYVEVANHAHARSSQSAGGLWRVQLEVSGEFAYQADGELIKLPTVALGTQAYETRTPAGVTSFGVELRLGDKSPAGVYRLTLKVTDAIGNKAASRAAKLVLV